MKRAVRLRGLAVRAGFFVVATACGGEASGGAAGAPHCPGEPAAPAISTVDGDPEAGRHARLLVDPSTGQVAIVYAVDEAGHLAVARRTDNGWTTEPILPAAVTVGSWIGRSLAIAAHPESGLVIAFHQADARNLQLAWQDGGGWVTEVVDPGSGKGLDVAMAVDDAGKIHLAYLDMGRGDLVYLRGAPGSWEAPEAVDAEDLVGFDPDIAVAAPEVISKPSVSRWSV